MKEPITKPFLNDFDILKYFYPTKHDFYEFLMSVHEKLPCSLSLSVAKQQLTSQRHCTFVTATIMPLAGSGRGLWGLDGVGSG
jgi:hypothetical protein